MTSAAALNLPQMASKLGYSRNNQSQSQSPNKSSDKYHTRAWDSSSVAVKILATNMLNSEHFYSMLGL